MFEPCRERPLSAPLRRASCLAILLAAISGCGGETSQGDDDTGKPQAGGSADAGNDDAPEAGRGGAGSSGSAGSAGTAADGGKGGSSPRAGSSGGSAGRAGSGGTAGAAGGAGSGEAGSGEAGSGEAGSGEPPKVTDGSVIAAALANAICDALRDCVGPAKLAALSAREDCVARFSASLAQDEFGSLATSIEGGSVVIDESKLESCYDDTRALGCDVVAERLAPSCQLALAGQRAAGDACTLNVDCGGELFCPISGECPRACEATRPAGEACRRDDECQVGLICNALICSEPATVGEPCAGTSGATCKLGLSCVGSTDTQPGACQTNASVQAGAAGAVCSPGGTLCREGLSCAFDSGSTFKCVAAVAKGATCKLALPSQCPIDTYCSATEVTATGKCMDLPVAGEACVLGDDCAPGHLCVTQDSTSTCRRIGDVGDECLADSLCRSGACLDGTCAVRPVCE